VGHVEAQWGGLLLEQMGDQAGCAGQKRDTLYGEDRIARIQEHRWNGRRNVHDEAPSRQLMHEALDRMGRLAMLPEKIEVASEFEKALSARIAILVKRMAIAWNGPLRIATVAHAFSGGGTFPRFPPENEVRSGRSAGGNRIRTIGPSGVDFIPWSSRFVADSPLEGGGFEPSVPLAETSRSFRRNGKCRRGEKSRLESGGPRVRIPCPSSEESVANLTFGGGAV
jgi:hypothetical protein